MDAKYFEEIKAREQAATPAPWYADGWELWDDDLGEFTELHDTDPDAQFIAHSRTDIPALIDEVERLKAVVQIQKASCSLVETVKAGNIIDENATLGKQIVTLKKALELACEDETNLCPYGMHGVGRLCSKEPMRGLKCKTCAPQYYIQQAQRQEGKES